MTTLEAPAAHTADCGCPNCVWGIRENASLTPAVDSMSVRPT